MQKQIMDTNLSNGNGAITTQNGLDKAHYDAAFDAYTASLIAGDNTWAGLNGLSGSDSDGNTSGILTNLQNDVNSYDALIEGPDGTGGVLGDLTSQINQLENTGDGTSAATGDIVDLEKLEAQFLSEYAGKNVAVNDSNYSDPATTGYTKTDAADALVTLIANSLDGHSSTVSNYQSQIKTLLDTISLNPADYSNLFTTLENAGALSDAQAQNYQNELGLLSAYASQIGDTSTPTLDVVSPSGPADQSAAKTLAVTVPAGKIFTVAATATGATVTVQPGSGYTTDSTDASRIAIDNTTSTESANVAVAYSIDFGTATSADLTVTATDTTPAPPTPSPSPSLSPTGTTTPAITPAVTAASAPIPLDKTHYVLAPADTTKEAIGSTDFAAISSYLSSIDTVSNLLLFLYGAPGQSLTGYIPTATASGYSFFADPSSIYNRYDAIAPGDILPHFWVYNDDGTPQMDSDGQHVFTNDVNSFYDLGSGEISQITSTINHLLAARGSLQNDATTLSGANLPKNYFATTLNQLSDWYTTATAAINAAPAAWQTNTNPATPLTPVAWADQDPGKSELYFDKDTGTNLYKTMDQLVASTSKQASDTAAAAQAIQDNSSEFTDLVNAVNQTKDSAQQVLTTTSSTITTGNNALKTNTDFNKNFAALFSNTRTPGANTQGIYDFFANPIAATDQTPKVVQPITKTFNFQPILLLVAGGLIGAAITLFTKRGTKKTVPEATSDSGTKPASRFQRIKGFFTYPGQPKTKPDGTW